MGQFSNNAALDMFKKVYGGAQDLVPEDYMLAKDIPFNEKQKVGDKYIEAAVLTNETGITFGGSGQDAFEINPAVAGVVKQVEVQPYVSVLPSLLPWATISRSVGAGEKAFYDATKFIVKNNIKSHAKFMEIVRLYGQATELLGYVSYATATYRGVAFTNGGGTLSVNGSNVTFTAGLNTSEKMILLAPGQFAAGIWVGLEGVIVQQVDANNVVVAEGKLKGMDTEKGVLVVDFTPVAASSTTSHRLCFKGMADAKETMGVKKILSATGSLFGIPVSQYALWKGNHRILSNVKFTYERLQLVIADAVNRGGLDGEVTCYVNPYTWATIVTDQAAARSLDQSYKPGEVEQGFEAVRFHSQNGGIVVKSHRMIKEGDGLILKLDTWSRSGSAEVGFKVPGMDKDIIAPVENMAAYSFKSYSDQYVFCNQPATNMLLTGINWESNS